MLRLLLFVFAFACASFSARGLSFASRRRVLGSVFGGGAGVCVLPWVLDQVGPVEAAEGARVWTSGKGDGSSKAGDKSGTKKDIGYLRCLSNCKADCESPQGGVARDRGECLQDCQDECCKTYEQCTYTIRE